MRDGNPRWGFSLFQLREHIPFKTEAARTAFDDLLSVELRAIAITKLFLQMGYLSPEMLEKVLSEQKLPPVKINELAAFFAGLLMGEGWDSEFKVNIFGEHSTSDGKFEVIHAAFTGLVLMMNERGVTEVRTKGPLALPPSSKKDKNSKNEQKQSAARRSKKKTGKSRSIKTKTAPSG